MLSCFALLLINYITTCRRKFQIIIIYTLTLIRATIRKSTAFIHIVFIIHKRGRFDHSIRLMVGQI